MIAATQRDLHGYREAFAAFEKTAPGRELAWLRKLRSDAFARFAEVGFPTSRDEDWRFTNVSPVSQGHFQLSRNGVDSVSAAQISAFAFPGSLRLVFVNGRFVSGLSSTSAQPAGVHVASLASVLQENPALAEPYLGRFLDTRRDAFCALNTAFLADGAYVRIAKSTLLEQPVHLLFVTSPGHVPTITHPRNLVVAESGSEAAIIEDYVSLDETPGLCNSATELIAEEGANVSHYLVEREHVRAFNFSTLRIQQSRNANVASHSILIGGALVRNNVHPVLAGEGAECLINGLFIGRGSQHLDNYMLVEHASPHCSSRQFYNGILDGRAHGVFHGRIVVREDAQKTDAKQTNRNLLLSDEAQIDTKPQLEIFADDVKCTHGATIGQIEEKALFYLRSRGIDEASARQLLLQAFASECLDRMKQDRVREHAGKLIHEHIFQMRRSSGPSSSAAEIAPALEEVR